MASGSAGLRLIVTVCVQVKGCHVVSMAKFEFGFGADYSKNMVFRTVIKI